MPQKRKTEAKRIDESLKNKQNNAAIFKTEFLLQSYLQVCDCFFSLEIGIVFVHMKLKVII